MRRSIRLWVTPLVSSALLAGCSTAPKPLSQLSWTRKPAPVSDSSQPAPTIVASSPVAFHSAPLAMLPATSSMLANSPEPATSPHCPAVPPALAATQEAPAAIQSVANNETMQQMPRIVLASTTVKVATEPDVQPIADSPTPNQVQVQPDPAQAVPTIPNATPINLPTALATIGGQHPVVGFARWRVQEAYAQLERAKVMWLPSIQSGMNYRRHDGYYQAVDGSIVDVNLNSLNYGLGAGAIAAGAPTRPGVVAQFHLADALFLPQAAEKTAWARGHAASATLNQQLLGAAVAYVDLLEAYQDRQIVLASAQRITEAATITKNFAEAGEGLRSDADRMTTELALIQTRSLAAEERQMVASTRLARALSVPMTSTLVPQDAVAVPLELTAHACDEASLIASGLANRPELKESQALVSAACEAYKREKFAPFVPSMLLGFSSSSFGGGLGSTPNNFGGRYDIDALMVWEMRNLGFGEQAARRERNSQVQQATFAKLRMMDQVAQEVAEANAQVAVRRQQVAVAESAIASARSSYQHNIDRIREAKGLPIEVLQSIQALETAERAYLRAVVDYNRAQLQLQWALGWPVDASAVEVSSPVVQGS